MPIATLTRRRVALTFIGATAGLLATLLGYLAVADPVIDAVAWDPPSRVELPPTPPLRIVARHGPAMHPEDVAVASDGTLYTGAEDGAVVAFEPGGAARRVAEVGGRPLGIAFDRDGHLIVCNHPLGLQRISPAGEVTLLTDSADGAAIRFANDLAIAADGTIYFSESSDRYHLANGFRPPFGAYDMLEARPRGRLLRYDPRDRSTTVLVRDLCFPNGVALSADETTILFCETFRYRVRRLELATGQITTVIDNLPGYPDGISRDGEADLYWIAMGVRRSALGDWVQRYPWLKNQVTKFPQPWWQRIAPEAVVMAIDERGAMKHTLHDANGDAGLVTNAVPHGRYLYLGNIDGEEIVKVAKP